MLLGATPSSRLPDVSLQVPASSKSKSICPVEPAFRPFSLAIYSSINIYYIYDIYTRVSKKWFRSKKKTALHWLGAMGEDLIMQCVWCEAKGLCPTEQIRSQKCISTIDSSDVGAHASLRNHIGHREDVEQVCLGNHIL